MPEAHPRQVVLYTTATGQVPFLEWLEGLQDRQARARIRTRLARVILGNLGDHHSVGSGVSELRLDHGPGYRVYLGQDGAALVILLCGGDKPTQVRDMQTAQHYWQDYQRRKQHASFDDPLS